MTGSRCSTVPSRYFRFFRADGERKLTIRFAFDHFKSIRKIYYKPMVYIHPLHWPIINLAQSFAKRTEVWLKSFAVLFVQFFVPIFFRFQMFYFMGETVLDSSCSFGTSKITSWTKTNFWKRSHEIEILLTKNTSTSLARKLIH